MIEAGQDGGLTQELLAGLFADVLRQRAVVLDFLERAKPALQAEVVSKIDGTCAALADPLTDTVAGMQDITGFEGWSHTLSLPVEETACARSGLRTQPWPLCSVCRRGAARKRILMLYYKRLHEEAHGSG